jgi:RND family efflux transporter MFP subunit
MNNCKLNLLFAGAILLAAAWCSGCKPATSAPAQAPAPPASVQLAQPRRGPIARFVTLPGEVKAYQQATLCAKVAGYMKTIAVDKGDRVKEGDLIAELEVPELLADRDRYRAELEVAGIEFKRLSESQAKAPDLVTPQSVDSAKAQMDIAKANLARTETLLNYARITAPFAGVITKRMADPGAFIPAATAGSTAENSAIVTLADLNRVRVQVAVPELEASLVSAGQPVKVSVDGLPGRMFEGSITRFSYALDEVTKTMLAETEMENSKLELRPGMYPIVRIGIERKADALLVPVAALLVEKAGPSVFVIVDQKAKKMPVKTGFNDGTDVEILSGVQAGQAVILIGKKAMADGQAVQLEEHK